MPKQDEREELHRSILNIDLPGWGFLQDQLDQEAEGCLWHLIDEYAQRKADEARIEELLAVQKSADAFDRMDHCGCDDYIPRRLATLNSQTPTPKNEMKRRGVA